MFPVTILSSQRTATNDVVVRLESERLVRLAKPGQYVHCAFDKNINKNKSVKPYFFSVNESSNMVELFFNAEMLEKDMASVLYVSEPCGEFFEPFLEDSMPVLVSDISGLPAIFFLADFVQKKCNTQPLVLLFSKDNFPFTIKPSQFVVQNFPAGMLATCQLLEDKKIPARLISEMILPGCYDGSAGDFFDELSDSFLKNDRPFYIAGNQEFIDALNEKVEKNQLKVQFLLVE